MAELTGLAFAILTTFNAVVEDIHYIQAIKISELEINITLVQLANVQLRLTRWGDALGLTLTEDEINTIKQESDMVTATLDFLKPPEDREQAKRSLDVLRELLKTTNGKTQRYFSEPDKSTSRKQNAKSWMKSHLSGGRHSVPLPGKDQISEDQDETNSTYRIVRDFSLNRAKRALQQLHWVLLDKDELQHLVNKATEIMEILEGLFEASKRKRDELARMEVGEIGEARIKEMLDALHSCDQVLEKAVKVAENQENSNVITTLSTTGETTTKECRTLGRLVAVRGILEVVGRNISV